MVEEVEKSSTMEDQTKNPNLHPDDEDELEEGEIVGDDDTSSSATAAIVNQPHPLEHSWTFWFDSPAAKAKQASWGSSIRPIYTFSTVEEFWSLYNNIHHPSKLANGADFYCFKHKIEPKWEDPVCAKGGKWTMSFTKGKSDSCWLYTLLAMIGEQFDHGDEICGAVVNVRAKLEKVSIWTKNAANESAQKLVVNLLSPHYPSNIRHDSQEDPGKERKFGRLRLCLVCGFVEGIGKGKGKLAPFCFPLCFHPWFINIKS